MIKLGSLEGTGALLLSGGAIANVEYGISISNDDVGLKLAFGWMRVTDQALKIIDQNEGRYCLRLEKDAGEVELAFDQFEGNLITFDVNGPVPCF